MPALKSNGNKDFGHFPTVFADYKDAMSGKIKPYPREVFLDYEGKDALFYDPSGKYISIIALIKSGMIDAWLPPCSSLEAIKVTYPNADISAVCAASDTGILYEHIGNGNWIPITINALQLASSKNDGLMSSTNYNQLIDCYGRTNIVFIDLDGYVPTPNNRTPNTIYEITKEVCSDSNDIIWDMISPIESIESAIKDDWDWDQLFDVDPETGKVYEIEDALHKIVASEMLVDTSIQVPAGYSEVHFMYTLGNIIENTVNGEYSSNWEFDRLHDYDANGNSYVIYNIGYKIISNKNEIGSMSDRVGKNGIEAVYYMMTKEVADS